MKEKAYYKVVEDILLYLYRKEYNEEEKQAQRRILYMLNRVCENKETFEEVVLILKKEKLL